jgi:hypothetical protein
LINGNKYEMFKLKNQEFTFDVDVSGLGPYHDCDQSGHRELTHVPGCGINGALYFVKMDADGGLAKYSTNKAGAPYGTGYCDAQCPRDLKFIAGKVRKHLSFFSRPHTNLTHRQTLRAGPQQAETPTPEPETAAHAVLRWISGRR